MAAIGDEVGAVFEQCRQHDAMFLRIVDPKRPLFQIGAARSDCIEIIEAPATLRLIQQRSMRDLRSPPDIADIDRAWQVDRLRREVARHRQQAAGSCTAGR